MNLPPGHYGWERESERCFEGWIALQILYRHGRLHMYRSGTDLLARSRQSLFVVTSGLVKMSYTDPFGSLQEYFLASGTAPWDPASHAGNRGRGMLTSPEPRSSLSWGVFNAIAIMSVA